MKTDPLNQGVPNMGPASIDRMTGALMMGRALELASLDGRSPIELSKADWEQAKRELTPETD